MSRNSINAYDTDAHVAEIYDQYEAKLDDIDFIRRLIRNFGPMKILEPFCGTGRILSRWLWMVTPSSEWIDLQAC